MYVERSSSCIVGWSVTQQRNETTLQTLLDESPQAVWYYSDLLSTYQSLLYTSGTHTPMPDKSQTFRVEGVNAELRHYLARLRRRTRCFSKCIQALALCVKLFVFAWNRRQLYRQRYPQHPRHLIDFVYP